MRFIAVVLACATALAPCAALAQPFNGQNAPAGTQGNRPATRPATRPAPPANGGTVNRSATGNGNTVNRNNVNVSGNTVNRNVNVNAGGKAYYPGYNGRYGNLNATNVNRAVIVNPVYRGPAWGWNHGVVWHPVPTYWGGGFWGGFAAGAATAVVFGTIVRNSTTYHSYKVAAGSPGATMLANYGLRQVQCGPPGLVVIYGPSNSVICAEPNSRIAAGYYNMDAANLSIVSQ